MSVLLIDSRAGGDWSLDLLYAGLVQNIGQSNVIDYPSYDKRRMRFPMQMTGNHEHDWGLERRSLSYVTDAHLFPRYESQQVTRMLRKGEIDMVFLDEREESYRIYMQLRANWFGVPVIVVSGHDSFQNTKPSRTNDMYGDRLQHAFVSNYSWLDLMTEGRFFGEGVRVDPYAWSINFDHLWTGTRGDPEKRLYDISFMGYNSHPDRARFIDHIMGRWPTLSKNIVLERRPGSFDLFVKKSEYFRVMSLSRICLNLRGAAVDGKTLRFWEIPYVGSCMLSQVTKEIIPDQLQIGTDYKTFANEIELDRTIEHLLDCPDERKTLANKARRSAMERHTSCARVAWMLKRIHG